MTSPATPLAPDRLRPDVLLVAQDEMARLLDLDRGRFYGLDAVGAEMLSLVLEQGQEATIAHLAREYGEDEQRLRADLADLLRDLRDRKLLAEQDHPSRCGAVASSLARGLAGCLGGLLLAPFRAARAVRRLRQGPDSAAPLPGVRTVGLLLRLGWLCLRLFGWTHTLALWRRWHRTAPAIDPARRHAVIQAVDRTVRQAAGRQLLLSMACKERALVGYQLLRAVCGLPATLVVGVERYPFGAHAWVECDGLCVTDDPDHCDLYTPVARYA